MRPASLSLLALSMLACSGQTDNPGSGAGGTGASAGRSGGRGGAAGTGAGGTAGRGTGGDSAGRGGGASGAPEAGQTGEGGEQTGAAGAGADAGTGGDAGADGGIDASYCGALTASLTMGSGTPSVALVPLTTTDVEGSACGAVERAFPLESAVHTTACAEIAYSTNPPSSGMHYGVWPSFKAYDTAVPRGFLVHALEHGAVVIGYSCEDCDDEVDAARALIAELGPDPLCCAEPSCTGASSRLILTPDPRLDTAWAASSWGFTLTADCFEPDAFRAFVEAHRGRGLEAVCSDGVDVANYQ
jgi:hypothetical protein